MLFGDSTLALRQWMRENGIAFEMQQNEPEDHFGTVLLLAAWLAENGFALGAPDGSVVEKHDGRLHAIAGSRGSSAVLAGRLTTAII